MLSNYISVSNILDAIIPISRFTTNELSNIFDEVNTSGIKIVVSNNKPACVVLTPELYTEIMETLENSFLFIEAEKRMYLAKDNNFISHEQLLKNLNIEEEELNDIEVEIE